MDVNTKITFWQDKFNSLIQRRPYAHLIENDTFDSDVDEYGDTKKSGLSFEGFKI